MTQSNKATWRSGLMLAAAGTLAGLVLGEVVVRLLGLAPQLAAIEIDAPHGSFVSSPNPVLGYVLKPAFGDVNEDGFRDRSYPRVKPDGTFRIVVVGDSIGFGYCNESSVIPVDETFANVLERELGAEGLPGYETVEVLNLSVSGYDTLQEIEFLREKGLPYAPDLVLVAFCLNDLMRASRELFLFEKSTDWQAYREAADLVYRGTIFRSHLARFVWHRLPMLADGVSDREPSSDPAPGLPRVVQGFQRLRSLGQRHAFDAAVVIFPFFRDFDQYRYAPLHSTVRAEAERTGLAVIDLFPVFATAAPQTTDLCVPCCDIHPNQVGHEVAARAVMSFLRETGF